MDALAPPEPSTTETYPGVKLSKGGTRTEGWRALREMLTQSSDSERFTQSSNESTRTREESGSQNE